MFVIGSMLTYKHDTLLKCDPMEMKQAETIIIFGNFVAREVNYFRLY